MTLNMSPEFMTGALCAQVDPEIFNPPPGGSPAAAKRICAGCDVAAQCLEYALVNGFRFGIYGGLTARQRARLRRDAA